jgi:ribosome-binding factor A
MSRRTERVGELLSAELSDILQHHMKDPRLNVLLSITEVQVAPDLKSARVYVSIMGDEAEQESAFQAVKAAAPYLRRELRPRLSSMRYVPELAFIPDHSIEHGTRLSALIDEVTARPERGS